MCSVTAYAEHECIHTTHTNMSAYTLHTPCVHRHMHTTLTLYTHHTHPVYTPHSPCIHTTLTLYTSNTHYTQHMCSVTAYAKQACTCYMLYTPYTHHTHPVYTPLSHCIHTTLTLYTHHTHPVYTPHSPCTHSPCIHLICTTHTICAASLHMRNMSASKALEDALRAGT